ncbi:MAG: hypothetical protein CML24_00615 [Rhizobiales bacterium]|nr:hypothetical protein [Hyphomicrobiales bacterium]
MIHGGGAKVKRSFLRSKRKKCGLTLKAVAEELGITFVHLSLIESGKKTPSLGLANKLEDFFKTPQRKLLQRDGENNNEN